VLKKWLGHGVQLNTLVAECCAVDRIGESISFVISFWILHGVFHRQYLVK